MRFPSLQKIWLRHDRHDQYFDIGRPNSSGFQFGLGVSISSEGDYGWGGAAGTRFWIDPKNQVIGIFMVQENPYKGANYENQLKKIVSDGIGEST